MSMQIHKLTLGACHTNVYIAAGSCRGTGRRRRSGMNGSIIPAFDEAAGHI